MTSGSLADLLAKQGRLSPEQVVAVVAPIADALADAHRRGVVHGAIKPVNIIFRDGTPSLSDFGGARWLSRPSADQPPTGTAGYLDPQVLDGAEPDARSDIYALGVVCYEALAGSLPFSRPTLLATMLAADCGIYPSLSEVASEVPPALAEVVEQAMHRRPEQRFSSAQAFAAALRASMGLPPVVLADPRPEGEERADDEVRSRSVAAGAGAPAAIGRADTTAGSSADATPPDATPPDATPPDAAPAAAASSAGAALASDATAAVAQPSPFPATDTETPPTEGPTDAPSPEVVPPLAPDDPTPPMAPRPLPPPPILPRVPTAPLAPSSRSRRLRLPLSPGRFPVVASGLVIVLAILAVTVMGGRALLSNETTARAPVPLVRCPDLPPEAIASQGDRTEDGCPTGRSPSTRKAAGVTSTTATTAPTTTTIPTTITTATTTIATATTQAPVQVITAPPAPLPSTTAPPPPSTTTTAPPKTDHDRVVDGYRTSWRQFEIALAQSNPNYSGLALTTTGSLLSETRSYINELSQNGRVARGPFELSPTLVSVNGNTAVIRDCVVDKNYIYDKQTNVPREKLQPRRVHMTIEMRRENGIWKRASIAPVAGSC